MTADPSEADVSFQRANVPEIGFRSVGLSLGRSVIGATVLLASLAVSPGIEGALGGTLALSMLAAASSNSRRYVVPNALSGSAFLLGLVRAAVANPGAEAVLIVLSHAAFAAGLFLLVRIAYRRLRGRQGLGLGDVKLAGVAGAWLSVPVLPIVIEIAALAALAVTVIRERKRARTLRAATRVPFGAFLAPAIWLGWLIETLLPALN